MGSILVGWTEMQARRELHETIALHDDEARDTSIVRIDPFQCGAR